MKKIFWLMLVLFTSVTTYSQKDSTITGDVDVAANAAKMLSAEHEYIKGNMRGAITIYREVLANDPMNLFAVKGRLNSQKGDGDAATWLPPLKSFRCAYVAQQIAVKAKYSLWVTAPEKEAMGRILTACPKQVLPQ